MSLYLSAILQEGRDRKLFSGEFQRNLHAGAWLKWCLVSKGKLSLWAGELFFPPSLLQIEFCERKIYEKKKARGDY